MALREGVIIGECVLFLIYMFMGGVPFTCGQADYNHYFCLVFTVTHPFQCHVCLLHNLKVLNMFHALFLLLYYFRIFNHFVVFA